MEVHQLANDGKWKPNADDKLRLAGQAETIDATVRRYDVTKFQNRVRWFVGHRCHTSQISLRPRLRIKN